MHVYFIFNGYSDLRISEYADSSKISYSVRLSSKTIHAWPEWLELV